jgi:K+-transporting ATPase A subunit
VGQKSAQNASINGIYCAYCNLFVKTVKNFTDISRFYRVLTMVYIITHRINVISDFVHRPDSKELEGKKRRFGNSVGVSAHLRTGTDPVSETSGFFPHLIL